MTRLLVPLLPALLVLGLGCSPDPCSETASSCDTQDEPIVCIGVGVGGGFAPYEDGQAVSLVPAPQGGSGVSIVLRTHGLQTGGLATAQLDVYLDDALAGAFTDEGNALSCVEDGGAGGQVVGMVVGFDQDEFGDSDALLALDGRAIELEVGVTDDAGNEAILRQPLTVSLGSR